MSVAATQMSNAGEKGVAVRDAAKTLFSPIVDEFITRELPNLRDLCTSTTTTLVNERLNVLPPLRVEIRLNEEIIANLPRQHYLFEVALRMLEARDSFGTPLNVALVGPAGTGKTRMGINAAEALKEEFILQPFNPQTTKSELVGYMDATGKYVESPFYKAFKNGKLFIADEFDAANPAVATVLNAAVSNRVMTFPNGETVKAHENFRTMFAMNTYGTGGDDRYTGRGRLDLATLDRMVFLYVPIDPGLEAALVGIPDIASPRVDVSEGGRFTDEREILHQIVNVRGAVEKEKLRYSISPRATIHACALHKAGFGKKMIMESCVWRGIPESEKTRISKSMAA